MEFDPILQTLQGAHSIEASAGTGKTYSITLIWLRLIIEKQLRVEEILVSTFTTAATAELKERLLSALRRSHEVAQALQLGIPIEATEPEALIIHNALRSGHETLHALSLRLTEALSAFDLAPISTLHSFCQSLISRHSVELGCDSNLRLLEDTTPLLEPLVDDQIMRMSERGSLSYEQLSKVAHAVAKQPYARLLAGDNAEGEMAESIASSFSGAKQQAGVRGFDDILTTVHGALRTQGPSGALAEAVRKRLKAAIIDECQDSDGIQIGVFEALFYHPDTLSFIVIGDPKQSIYRFRGADLASYKTLASRAVSAPPMTRNHRSDGDLIEALNAAYAPEYIFPDTLSPGQTTHYIPVTAAATSSRIQDPAAHKALVIQWSDSAKRDAAQARLAEQVAAECRRLLSAGVSIEDRHTKQMRPLQPGDIAVLANGHRELRLVRQKLAQAGIPNQSSGSGLGSVFASLEAADLLAWLELYAALEKRGNVLGKLLAFLGTPLGGISPVALQTIGASAEEQAKLCETFRSQLPQLFRSGPLPLLLKRLGENDVIQTNLSSAEGERRYTNWRQIGSLLQHEHGRGRRGARALALWLARMNTRAPRATNDDPDANESALMKLETDSSAVQLATIHSSKGLEYPVVFCPFLWQVPSAQVRKRSPFAIRRTPSEWLLDAASADLPTNLAAAMEQEDEESHRKNYVALTRARHRLYIGLAPVEEGRGGHKNGADRSVLTSLKGLQLDSAPPQQWPDVLRQNPTLSLQCEEDANGAPPGEPFAGLISAPIQGIQFPPKIPSYSALHIRTHSFSSLSRTDQEQHSPADRDWDQAGNKPGATDQSAPDLLAGFEQKGAILGDQLHSILEDFLGNRKPLDEALASRKSKEIWERVIPVILETPLQLGADTRVSLGEMRERCITEMQFHLPVEYLDPERLSQALLKDPKLRESDDASHWAGGLSAWTFGDFAGFLQGFIDLIFEHEGRWFVADYKSNRLEAYDKETLQEAMLEKNYLLQARFYALALHRHLQVHLEDYDFERHFGGVAYLFVRGFPAQGLWFERPSLEAIESLGAPFQLLRS
jgi:exodeoxyribonuclease V beta subunit